MSAGTGSFSLADRRRGHCTVSSPPALLRAISFTPALHSTLIFPGPPTHLSEGGHFTHGFYTSKTKVSATSVTFESMPY